MVNKSSPRFPCTVFLKYASAYQFELLARYQSTWQRGKCCVRSTKRISIKYSIKRSLHNSHVRHWSITWGQDHPVSPNQLRRIEHLNFPAKVAFILFNCPGQTSPTNWLNYICIENWNVRVEKMTFISKIDFVRWSVLSSEKRREQLPTSTRAPYSRLLRITSFYRKRASFATRDTCNDSASTCYN